MKEQTQLLVYIHCMNVMPISCNDSKSNYNYTEVMYISDNAVWNETLYCYEGLCSCSIVNPYRNKYRPM